MPRIALGLAYDGTSFEGWQTQPHGNTLQDHLEKALSVLAGCPVETICAGRTDAGVHAFAQVVHFDAPVQRPLQAWVRGVNVHLPKEMSVQWAHEVTDSFHARFSAQWRAYEYRIYCSPVRHPLIDRAAWSLYPLDTEAMQTAANSLLGTHDFSSFRAAQCQANTPVRELMTLKIQQNGAVISIYIRGNAFLHHMVRNIVGSLVEVGLHRKPVEWIAEVLAAKNRSVAARTWPSEGLTFVGVGYDDAFGLPVSALNPASVL